MANTVVVYPGDGVTRQFTVPFDYLNRTFVHVYLNNDTEETQGTTWRFISPTVIERTAAPLVGETLTIRRMTSTNRIVDFKDASVLRSFDLNTSQIQVLHIAEEAKDMTVDTIGTDIYGNLDARWRRVVHVSSPVEDGDALNFGTYKADLNGAAVARDRAEAAATKAEASAVTSKNWADAASSHKVAAEASEAAAKESETAASTSATTATNKATEASTSASKAKTEADAAKGWAEAAKGHADAAKVSEDAAQNVVDNAVEIVRGEFADYVSDAEGYATSAKGWSDQAKAEADRAEAAADSVDVSVFESRVSALEDEDVTINQKINNTNSVVSGHTTNISTLTTNLGTTNTKVTALTTRMGDAETDITNLQNTKLRTSGGNIAGGLTVRGGVLRNSFNNLNFNTSTTVTGLNLEWTDGVNKTWNNATNATMVYHELMREGSEWLAGVCGGWKVNGEITTHAIHVNGSGKLLLDRQEVRYVKQSYLAGDLTKWYRIWSDGWIEQGGTFTASGDSTINYPTPFANNLGEIKTLMVTLASGNYGNLDFAAFEASNTSFNLVGSGWNGAVRFNWFVCGF